MRDILRFLIKIFAVYLLLRLVCAPPALLPTDDPSPIQEHDTTTQGFAKPTSRGVIVALVSDDFLDIEVSILNEAKNYIEYQTNKTITIIYVSEANIRKPLTLPTSTEIFPIIIRKVDDRNEKIREVDAEAGGPVLGFYDKDASPAPSILIVSDRIQGEDVFQGVVMHEMMHSIGMLHSSYEGQLMYPVIDAVCLGARDELQLAHIFGVSAENMIPCISEWDDDVCLLDVPWNY